MGEAARARVAKHFSLAASVQHYCDLYDKLIARKAGASEQL